MMTSGRTDEQKIAGKFKNWDCRVENFDGNVEVVSVYLVNSLTTAILAR